LLKDTKGANQSAVFLLLIVHYIPEPIVHYMTECPRFSRCRHLKKIRKKEKIRIKKVVHYVPNSVEQYKPESIVHYIPEYSFKIIDKKIKEKTERIHLLLSSPGGSVFHGLSLYNFLKGAPVEVHTYNFGSVDSIGVVIFCAGSKRFSVPHARFLIHGVRFNINGNVSFDEKQIEEHLKSLKIDQLNIARIIADNTGKSTHKIEEDMINRTTLNPHEAKDYGLVHEIKSELFPIDADLVTIGEVINQKQPFPFQVTVPQVQGFTRSQDLDIITI
jgi:ATP-dependent Clp protease, protease subunit